MVELIVQVHRGRLPAIRSLNWPPGPGAIHAKTRILEFVQQQSINTSQFAGRNKLHDVEARLARWLLLVQDRTEETSFQLTEEFLAEMFGTKRTTVAPVAGTLQRGGFIEYARGRVAIKSIEELRTVACDCYDVTLRLLNSLYPPL